MLGVSSGVLVVALVLPQATRLDPEECVLSGVVVDTDGQPVVDASVVLRTKTPGESLERARTLTNASGRFTLSVERIDSPRFWRDSFLRVEAAGRAPSVLDHVYVPPPACDVGPVVLYAPVELIGRVVTSRGSPVEGARIHAALGPASAPYGDHARRDPVAVTDANGTYSCRLLPPGLVTLGASAEGLADVALEPVELRSERPNVVDFELTAERVVRLRISSETGAPLADASAEPLGDLEGDPPYRVQDTHLPFWRGLEVAGEDGEIVIRRLGERHRGDVRVRAPGYRPVLASLAEDDLAVELEPVIWIEVSTHRAGGATPPELHRLTIRDMTLPASWCGNCDQSRLVELYSNSPAVQRLGAGRWRVAWNAPGYYVDGGRPGEVTAYSVDCGRASFELPEDLQPGSRVPCPLEFAGTARLSGVVQTRAGEPVSIRLGVGPKLGSDDACSTSRSDSDGRFEFESLGPGTQWIYALDDRWTLHASTGRFELTSGQSVTDAILVVEERPDRRTGRVRGVLRIGGQPPEQPILLALDEVPNQHLPSAHPRGFAWTDDDGRFEIDSFWSRRYHILAKHHASSGGWRDFGAEFPAHDSRWPWTVHVPQAGVVEVEIDLPPEREWDEVAPATTR